MCDTQKGIFHHEEKSAIAYHASALPTIRGPARNAAEIGNTMEQNLCECGCGQETTIATYDDARNGAVKGQPRRFIKHHTTHTRNISHGEAMYGKHTPEYRAFLYCRARCNNPNCKGWQPGVECLFATFAEFLACVGRRPTEAHRLCRFDTTSDYKPGNVHWYKAKRKRRHSYV